MPLALASPYFKDIYLYLALNKLLSTKTAVQKVETLVEKFALLNSLLFKIITTPEKETALFTILEICRQNYYTLSLKPICMTSRIYLTNNNKFFIPNSIHYL